MEHKEILAISLSVFSLFFIFIVSSTIKNFLSNSNSFSRGLRVHILVMVLIYLLVFIIFVVAAIFVKKVKNAVMLPIIFTLTSILVMSSLIKYDFSKLSVRDEWKYKAQYYKNFKTPKPKQKFDIFMNTLTITLIVITMSLSVINAFIDEVINDSKVDWFVIGSSISVDLFIIIFFIALLPSRKSLLKKNIKYNALKNNILSDLNIDKNTKKATGKKLLELYNDIFLTSKFYKKNTLTNNAIIHEIAKQTGLAPTEYEQYLRDPCFYNNPITFELLVSKYEFSTDNPSP